MPEIDRANVGYNPSVELAQVKASPSLQDVQVRRDSKSKAQQLWEQFGNQGEAINTSQKLIAESDKQQAEQLVNSMTTDELAAKIKSGELHNAHSPVFNATVNHMHYDNIAQNTQRDILQKLQDGVYGDQFASDPESMKYDSAGMLNPNYRDGNQKLEKFLLDQRNQQLTGADKFGVAGYDRYWQPFVQKALQTNTEAISKKAVEFGHNTAVESYMGSIAGAGTPDEKLSRFLEVDKKADWIFKGDKSRRLNARLVPLGALADAGDVETLDKILNTKDKDGISISSTLGTSVNSLRSKAYSQAEANANKAEVNRLKDVSEASVMAIHQNIAENIKSGTAWKVPKEVPYEKPDGTKAYMPTEPIILQGLSAQADQLNVPPDQKDLARLNLFNKSGYADPDSKIKVMAAIHNLNSVEYDEKGKPLGQLNESLKTGLDLLAKSKSVDPTGTLGVKLAGGQDNYDLLNNVDIIRANTSMTLEEAAGVVARSKGSLTYGDNNTAVSKSAGKILDTLNNGFFMRLLGAEDNATFNIENIKKGAVKTANLLVSAGMSPDGAIKVVSDNFKNNVVNIQGNLLYTRAIPSIPEANEQIVGGSPTLMKRWLEEIGGQAAYQTGFNPKEVQVSVDPDGNTFTLTARGQPLNGNGHQFIYSKQDIEQWMTKDIKVAAYDKQLDPARVAFNARTARDIMGAEAAIDYMTSRTGYRELVKANMENKPKLEQIQWAKDRMANGATIHDPATPIDRPENKETVQKPKVKQDKSVPSLFKAPMSTTHEVIDKLRQN
jgi:hypothetical protein